MRSNFCFNGLGVGELVPPNTNAIIGELLAKHPGHNNAPNSPHSGVQLLFYGNAQLRGARDRGDWQILSRFELVFIGDSSVEDE